MDAGRIEAAVREILAAIGEDPHRAGLDQTPRRVAESFTELFSGLGASAAEHLADAELIESSAGQRSELVLMRNIDFRSMCEHHLLPFSGHAHVAYIPRDRIAGLGRLPRVVDTLASRPQLQERLTEEIANVLQAGLDPLGVLVVLDATQSCVTHRGTRQARAETVTMASRGVLREPTERAEVLALISSRS